MFVDFFTTWCGPCKMMSNKVFPQKEVGDFMNAKFIPLKLDAEKEGAALAKQYGVKAYPTYVVMDGDGKEVAKFSGYMDGPKFIEKVTVSDLSEKLRRLRLMGVSDIIIDPGFGFSKTTEQNFEMMRNLQLFKSSLGAPVLVGVSRKSMITKSLGITPMEALPGTIALDTIALTRGASILRVHDVSEAVAAVRMYELSTL